MTQLSTSNKTTPIDEKVFIFKAGHSYVYSTADLSVNEIRKLKEIRRFPNDTLGYALRKVVDGESSHPSIFYKWEAHPKHYNPAWKSDQYFRYGTTSLFTFSPDFEYKFKEKVNDYTKTPHTYKYIPPP